MKNPTNIRERIVIYKIEPELDSVTDTLRGEAQTKNEVAFLPGARGGASGSSDIVILKKGESYPTDCHKTGWLGWEWLHHSDEECYYNDGKDDDFVGVLPYDRVIYKVYEDNNGRYVKKTSGKVSKLYIRGTLKESTYEAYSTASVTFYINPNHITIDEKKMKRKIRTYGGWEFQFWGPDIGTISLKGSTRGMIPNKSVRESSDSWGVYDSISYQAFKELEDFYKEDHRVDSESMIDSGILLGLSYRDRVYVGHFDSFTFEEDAQKPWVFEYNLKFSIEFEATDLAAAIETLGNRKIYDANFTKILRGEIE